MVDKFSKETRSYIMSRIRGKDTKPEIIVRSYLFSRGLRFRKNDKRYPGSSDVVLPKYNTVIFVHGCFWHLHDGCKYARIPKSNVEYWEKKLYRNKEHDNRNQKELKGMGWNVITVWECELKKDKVEQTLEELYIKITSQEEL
jgi:DNA mismatch endonuclease (patch repair protein)